MELTNRVLCVDVSLCRESVKREKGEKMRRRRRRREKGGKYGKRKWSKKNFFFFFNSRCQMIG